MLHGVHASWWPNPLNTLVMNVNPVKSVLNPLGIVIFYLPWKGDMKDTFLEIKHALYIRRLVNHLDNFPNFVLSHPIGSRPLSLRNDVYKALV